ncbi:putative multitransmembrane protein [Sphaerochaeta pleomorpha str. Grapes]|uniref:Putative multitransmembrane protein n=1 Tax=Sphaerochaeta pleomorpha (strain ATCC BAA-1885 / DSM 22778 / Grapes) TaxID=158190 RepID=G8QQA5_SPHPG|nr:YibE/F family protein [Sphaerochaeta pleomorpha]AEV29750.1 putative multitransmembrane protein [Sphaerochaeta pleomorpha str. Grapes]
MKLQFNRKEAVFLGVFSLLCLVLVLLPTGFGRAIYVNAEGAKARVIKTNDTMMYQTGVVRMGEQRCTVEILSGPHTGEQYEGINLLTGKLEFDKVFTEGQLAWVLLEQDSSNKVIFTNMVDHYRLSKELQLMGLFALLLVVFSGYTGIRTILSFLFAFLAIWKVMIPFALKGYSPILLALLVGSSLMVMTLLLVGGCTKKAYAAIIGSVGSSLITCLLAILFTVYFQVHGSVMQWSESLLYAGYMKLDLTKIFQAAVYLSCSGAILDLSIDISAALSEIVEKKPDITAKELVASGLVIGKSVVGSQTTTLLLAYMGSYLTVMMVYMAQGTPIMSILNSKTIAAEILHTFVGCIGLVLVSPLTSLVCGWLYIKKPALSQERAGGVSSTRETVNY